MSNALTIVAGYTDSNIQSVLERYMSKKNNLPEWITTRQAQDILKVTTTQGVWNVITRANRYHDFELNRRNIGTDKKPRYLLLKSDVEQVAILMNKTDD